MLSFRILNSCSESTKQLCHLFFSDMRVIVTAVKTLGGDEMTSMIVEMITEERTGESTLVNAHH